MERRLAHLRVVEVQLAVFGDDVLTAVGDQELIEEGVAIPAVGGQLEPKAIDVAHALLAQISLHALEEIVEDIPILRDVRHFVAGLLDQRPPGMVGKHIDRIGDAVNAAFLLDIVVAAHREQRGLGVCLTLRRHDVGQVDQHAVPGVEGNDLGRVVLKHIRDNAAGHCRGDPLAQRRRREDRVFDRVAARLLVIRDDLLERNILLVRETLRPQHINDRGRGVGDVGARQHPGSGNTQRAAEHRTPGEMGHHRPLPCRRRRCFSSA